MIIVFERIFSSSHRLNVFEGLIADLVCSFIEGVRPALRVNEEPGFTYTLLVRQVLTEGRLTLKSNLFPFLGEDLL